MDTGANGFTMEEIESLLAGELQSETPPTQTTGSQSPATDSDPKPAEGTAAGEGDVTKTQAFAHRLKESTDKARKEEREAIAKSFGYDSYDAMLQAKEQKVITDKGLDPTQVTPVIEELVKQRLNDDPRLKELERFRAKEVEDFGKKELAEITKLTGGEITKLTQLPKEVLDLWKQKGSLKSAYLEVEGENLITKIRSEQSKGSTSHLNTPASNGVKTDSKTRPLTEQERKVYREFFPNITDEELNKKTVNC